MPDRKEINKRGYLKEDFRLFHLKDSRAQKVDYHYHAFDKLILLLGGKVTYVVEGVTYFLQPWDLLLVGHDLIHRPIIDPAEPYERVVIWLGREWLERRSDPGEALDTCFDTTRERGFHLLRFDAERRLHYMQRIQQLEEALRDRSFGAARMADTLCQQMLIDVNRDVLRSRTAQEERDSYRVDPKMEEVLRYILDHLGEELTVESLSKRFFISRYYLMHRFKAVTGYTVHQYISQKRLLRAGELIRAGVPVMKAAEQAGFEEYSTMKSIQLALNSASCVLVEIFIVGTNDPKGVPRPVVKSTSWQPERASAEAATRSLPGACKRFNPGFVTGCA